ncbi:MAG TPA: hypothetical protein VGO92_06205 [Acidimicrobiales bacterium]|jgi:hypothetical protein|nr:hypothetical protein [Acidimicrobiales bacterium]
MKRIIMVLAVLGLVGLGAPQARAGNVLYQAPFAAGPAGGDPAGNHRTHYTNIDPATGKVDIFWANLTPGAIGCAAQGGFGYLRVTHQVTDIVGRVVVSYKDLSMTPYSWLKVNVRGVRGGEEKYLGSYSTRGQKLAAGGDIPVPLDAEPDVGSALTIDFGAEIGSACPNADGVTVTFTQVAVS